MLALGAALGLLRPLPSLSQSSLDRYGWHDRSPEAWLAQTPINPERLDPSRYLLEGYCYLLNQQVGVYQEPNPRSVALGILPPGTVVLLGGGSGQGWVRVQSPVVGWIGSSVLQVNPQGACNGLGSVLPPTQWQSSTSPTQTPNPTGPTGQPTPTSTPPPLFRTIDQKILCKVMESDGLEVRNQPLPHPRTLIAILEPGDHEFVVTDRQVRLNTNGQVRDWLYITQPVDGWIVLRQSDQATPTIQGENCS